MMKCRFAVSCAPRWRARRYHVVEAESGQLGIREVALSRPDVVIAGPRPAGHGRHGGAAPHPGVEPRPRARGQRAGGRRDKIAALNAGADDYVHQALQHRELIARLRAIQRRADPAHEAAEFVAGDLHVDYVKRAVTVKGVEAASRPSNTPCCASSPSTPARSSLKRPSLREVWGPQGEAHGEYLRVHLTHLRKKIEIIQGQRLIRTEPGIGYRMTERETGSNCSNSQGCHKVCHS